MNTINKLNSLIINKNSLICVEFNVTFEDIPKSLKLTNLKNKKDIESLSYVIYEYCIKFINAICDVIPAIKISSAFFEKENLMNIYLKLLYYAKRQNLFVIVELMSTKLSSIPDDCFDAVVFSYALNITDIKLKNKQHFNSTIINNTLNYYKNIKSTLKFDNYITTAITGKIYIKNLINPILNKNKAFSLVPSYGINVSNIHNIIVCLENNETSFIMYNYSDIINAYKKDFWNGIYSEKTWEEATMAEAIRITKAINQTIFKL